YDGSETCPFPGAISSGNLIKYVKTVLKKYNPASTQITPISPMIPINKPTMTGPINTGSPAPKFNTASAAPLSFETSEGTNADNGTYAARQAPQTMPMAPTK